ncbi:MAG: hypothetical protein K1X64_14035 [Myxococcaceae bacterium]|nr:hypothetical protein [Myxococcaceae bacterium]
MTWKKWKTHFEANAKRPLPEVSVEGLSPAQRRALLRSLQIFQIGETGEGRIAHQIDQVTLPGIDADYRAALKLFVKEEGRHAGILARAVLALDGQLLKHAWAAKAFTHARQWVGVRFKLLVLLVAEVIGIAFYGLISRALPGRGLKAALAQLCDDEEQHLRFHCQFFAAQAVNPLSHALLRLAWWPLALAAGLAVLWDHRAALRGFHIGIGAAAGAMLQRVRESARLMQGPATARLRQAVR